MPGATALRRRLGIGGPIQPQQTTQRPKISELLTVQHCTTLYIQVGSLQKIRHIVVSTAAPLRRSFLLLRLLPLNDRLSFFLTTATSFSICE